MRDLTGVITRLCSVCLYSTNPCTRICCRYEIWNPGQPDNNNEEDCVESLSLAVWNDFTCEIRSFACYFCSTEGKNSMSLNEESISVVKQERTFFTPKFDRICPKIVNFYAFLVSKIHKIFRLSKFSPKY